MGNPVSAWDSLVRIGEELPKWWMDPQQKDLRDTLGYVVPQSPAELGLMIATGPLGKAIKLGGLALAGGTYSPDAEAGWLRFLSPDKIQKVMQTVREKMGSSLHNATAHQVARESSGVIPLTGSRINPNANAVDSVFLDTTSAPYVHPVLWDNYRGKQIEFSADKARKMFENTTSGDLNRELAKKQSRLGLNPDQVGTVHPGNAPSANSYNAYLKENPELADVRVQVGDTKGSRGYFDKTEGPSGLVMLDNDLFHPGNFDFSQVFKTFNHEALGHGWLNKYARNYLPDYTHRSYLERDIRDFQIGRAHV